jgi:hypothetical protein
MADTVLTIGPRVTTSVITAGAAALRRAFSTPAPAAAVAMATATMTMALRFLRVM